MTIDSSAQEVGDSELKTEGSPRILEDTHSLFPGLTEDEALDKMKHLIYKRIELLIEWQAEKEDIRNTNAKIETDSEKPTRGLFHPIVEVDKKLRAEMMRQILHPEEPGLTEQEIRDLIATPIPAHLNEESSESQPE